MTVDAPKTLQPSADEQRIALTDTFALLQKRKGHRYSVDDMLVAHLAVTFAGGSPGQAADRRPPERVLDLGCGLGSVLLITAWALPEAQLVGLEVLGEHVAYAKRNVRLNGCQDRVQIVQGDLRDASLIDTLGSFDLVTGSPPYFAPDSGTHCADAARAAAHFELRGGIEDYARAAAGSLAPAGLFVCCAPADPPERAREALARAQLSLLFFQPVVPRVGKPPFLVLMVAAKAGVACEPVEAAPLVLRDAVGQRSPQQVAIREWTGIPCPESR